MESETYPNPLVPTREPTVEDAPTLGAWITGAARAVWTTYTAARAARTPWRERARNQASRRVARRDLSLTLGTGTGILYVMARLGGVPLTSYRWAFTVTVLSLVVPLAERLTRGSHRRTAWTLIAGGELLTAAGGALYGTARGGVNPFSGSSANAVLVTLIAVMALVGAVAFAGASYRVLSVTQRIDSLAAGLSFAGLLAWAGDQRVNSVALDLLGAHSDSARVARVVMFLSFMGVALFVAVSVALASGAVFRTMVWMSGASVSVLVGYALSRLTSQGALDWRGSWIDVAWITAFLMTAVAAHQDDGAAWCGRADAARGVEAIKIAVVGLAALLTIALSEHVGESAMGETLASGAVVVLGVRLLLSLSNESRHADTLEHLAETDALTGLANRRALEAGRVDAEAGGVLLFDLDDFKQVNDSLGHRAGDLLLRAVAARVAGVMESDQRLYRLGGDEFAIVCPTGTREDLVEVAHRVLGAVVAPVIVDGVSLRVGASVGVAPQRAGRATGELLRRADVAMYGAKAGHSGVEVYEFAHDRNDPARLALYGLVRDAVESGTIGVHFQPLWGLSESTVIGYEALARWNAPGVGEVEPARFVPMIEIQGLTAVFTDLVLDRALETAAHLGDASGCRLSVNVTADDLARDGFAERVLARCATHGVASERLTLEVVESAFSVDTRALVATITTLRASGIRISLDDFGTGFSSLSRLGRLPVDEVKIDRSILVEALASSRAATVLRSTVTLAHDLGIDVVVEGIESEAALALITELGADVAQGFLIGRPGPAGTCAGRVAAIRAGWSIEGEDGVHEVAD